MPHFGITLTTDRAIYASGDQPLAIAMTLNIVNHTDEPVEFNFSSAQRYDLAIADEHGDEVWRWSAERMFAQMLGAEILGPGNEEASYSERHEGILAHGIYRITGTLTAIDRPLLAEIAIEVR
jgi:hypothetical protein